MSESGDASGGSNNSSSRSDTEDSSDDTTSGGNNEDSPLAGLDHSAVLAIGLEGGAAITCGYSFDEAEMAQQRKFTSGWSTPEAIIHINGEVLHWKIPQPKGQTSHVLGHNGSVYAWKTPGDGKGAQSKDTGENNTAALAELLQKKGHDCVAFTGPASMFEVPTDVTFKSLG